MDIKKGSCLTLRLLPAESYNNPENSPAITKFEIVEEYMIGEGGTAPQVTGVYIQVTIDRKFRVIPVRDTQVEELD